MITKEGRSWYQSSARGTVLRTKRGNFAQRVHGLLEQLKQLETLPFCHDKQRVRWYEWFAVATILAWVVNDSALGREPKIGRAHAIALTTCRIARRKGRLMPLSLQSPPGIFRLPPFFSRGRENAWTWELWDLGERKPGFYYMLQ